MAKTTKIQWCDSTINPVMGCDGCELFPTPGKLLHRLDKQLARHGDWPPGKSKQIYQGLIWTAYDAIPNPASGHSRAITTTNLWHLRHQFFAAVFTELGKHAADGAENVMSGSLACYAARLHLNKARSILNPERGFNSGYAPSFETVTKFQRRVAEAARSKDLIGSSRPDKPWMDGLPRHIFVSDMGDAFSKQADFGFLISEVIDPIRSAEGARHVWLWLTKRPKRMAAFSEQIGGLPSNVITMTTLTSPETLHRVDALRQVRAAKRGLSIEPLRARIAAESLDLTDIDWVIVGGESGRRNCVHPFDLSWARELRDHCRENKVAYFVKQLGRRPIENGTDLRLKDGHGGDWAEWPEDLRVREMPEKFRIRVKSFC